MGRPSGDKRDRLVSAAIDCFHEGGYARTSLARVAERAGVAPGNVFYYFRSKDDLARSVVDEWRHRLASYLSPLEDIHDPWLRLRAFVDQGAALGPMYVARGCPLAGLTRDLRQENAELAHEAPRIYAVQFDWLAEQFKLAGLADAAERARSLMARYHGAIQLAYAQADDGQLVSEMASLKTWLADLAAA